MPKPRTSALRIAIFIRVSTEKQEKQGESLATQKSQIDQAVKSIGGQTVAEYGGQEHATAGWEKEQLSRLLEDATKGKFDAVMVAHPDRWSRDNVASATGLELLSQCGVRFFVLSDEQNLFDPQARLLLAMHAAMGAYHAGNQTKKSIENRIARAQRGLPTAGKRPFGRRWDKVRQEWSIDVEKQQIIVDCAKRYLAGVSMAALAEEYGMNHSALHKTLMQRCGSKWVIRFKPKNLKIAEEVTIDVPALLDEKTIQALNVRAKSGRTYSHGETKNSYALGGRVFCAACGYKMFGQTNANGLRYYRHAHTKRDRKCPLSGPRPWVPAPLLEGHVIPQIFNTFGNVAKIEQAIKAAIPNRDAATEKLKRIVADLEKLGRTRQRLLDLLQRDVVEMNEIEGRLMELKAREGKLTAEKGLLEAAAGSIPEAAELRAFVIQEAEQIVLCDWNGNGMDGGNDIVSLMNMSPADSAKLVERAFGAAQTDGRPSGVYVAPVISKFGGKRFTYTLRGRLLRTQKRITQGRSANCAWHSPDTTLPECYSAGQFSPHLQ